MTDDRNADHHKDDISTARALGLSALLVAALLAAGTGVLAAADAFGPDTPTVRTGAGRALPTGIATASTPNRRAPAPVAGQPAAGQPSSGPRGADEVPPAPPTAPTGGGSGRSAGFGATVADWNAKHAVDPAVGGNTAYNPDPELATDGRLADRYIRVLPLDGRILQYTIQFPRNTAFTVAAGRALAELPSDVRPVWQRRQPNCVQAAYTSPKLAELLGDIGDPRGAVLIEYRSGVAAGSAWDGQDVTNATLSAFDARTPADAPLC